MPKSPVPCAPRRETQPTTPALLPPEDANQLSPMITPRPTVPCRNGDSTLSGNSTLGPFRWNRSSFDEFADTMSATGTSTFERTLSPRREPGSAVLDVQPSNCCLSAAPMACVTTDLKRRKVQHKETPRALHSCRCESSRESSTPSDGNGNTDRVSDGGYETLNDTEVSKWKGANDWFDEMGLW